MPLRAPLALRNLAQPIHEFQILLKVLPLEPRQHEPKVPRLEIIGRFDLASDEAAAERGVGDRGDTELAAGFQQVDLRVFDVHGEGGVLDLDGGDVVDFTGAAEGGGGDFRETKIFDFAGSVNGFTASAALSVSFHGWVRCRLPFQLDHCFDGLFNGCLAIDAVTVVEIDAVNA